MPVVGCYQTLPTNWEKDIPGLYEGSQAEFREVMEFKQGGICRHEVYVGGRSILNETSRWSALPNRFVIYVDNFTEFYDPAIRKFGDKGKALVGYEFRPLSEGGTFDKLAAGIEFQFCLTRKKSDARGTNPNAH